MSILLTSPASPRRRWRIFTCGAADETGSVAKWLYDATGTNATSSIPAKGVVTLSAADVGLLLAGNTYVNVHSEDYPAGEIRDQLHRADSGKLLTGNAQVLVKNEWDSASPATDIDTIVLGPQPGAQWVATSSTHRNPATLARTCWRLSVQARIRMQAAARGYSTPPPAATKTGSPRR
ncbi:MAG: CHRD domain-containing protein [Caldilineaceae bacterium]